MAEKYGTLQAFAAASGTSIAGVKNWLPPTGPSGERRARVAELLDTTPEALTGDFAPVDSPVQADRIEAKLDALLAQAGIDPVAVAMERELEADVRPRKPRGSATGRTRSAGAR